MYVHYTYRHLYIWIYVCIYTIYMYIYIYINIYVYICIHINIHIIDSFWSLCWLINNRAICTRIALLFISTLTGTAVLLIWRSQVKRQKVYFSTNISIKTENRSAKSVYTHTYIYTYIHAYIIHMCIYIFIRICLCIQCIHIHVYMSMYTYTCLFMHICLWIHVYIHIHIYTHICDMCHGALITSCLQCRQVGGRSWMSKTKQIRKEQGGIENKEA